MSTPSRAEIWYVNLDPTEGREQRGVRPALVLSVDRFNQGPAELIVVVPITMTDRRIPAHIRVEATGSGLRETSFIMCEALRSVSKHRLGRQVGSVDAKTMAEVEYAVAALLGL